MKKALMLSGMAALTIGCNSTKEVTSSPPEHAPVHDVDYYAKSITANDLKTTLYTYASDEFEGRETGQSGQKKAVEYLKQKYVDLGIPPAQANGNYFQEVPLEIVKTPKADLTVNGTTFEVLTDFVSVLPSNSGSLNASEVVFAGYGIEDSAYSDYTNIDVAGKVVIFKSGEPKNSNGTFLISGATEPSKWSNFRNEFSAKREIAKAKGAKAILFYAPEIYERVASRSGASQNRMSLRDKQENLYFFIIDTKLAKAIMPSINTEITPKVIQTDLTLNFEKVSEKLSSENVVAYLKGTEKPDEVIIVSAHLDHEGIKDGEVYNGADDDGSGSVAVLEIAEAFKKAANEGHGPKRSILFLHVTGEEKGLLGSSYYADINPIIPLNKTLVDLNIDMIGRTDPKRKSDNRNYIYLIGSDKLSSDLHNISEAVNKSCCNIELDYTFNDENDPNRFYYRSDHYNFAKNNIPVIFYFNGTHADYHKPSDTPDKIQYDLLENRTRLVFYTAWELANRDNKIVVDKAIE